MRLSFIFLAAVTSVASARISRRAPLTPDLDPFYKPPAGWESKAPGDILATRRVTGAYIDVVPLPLVFWQLLYRTTDAMDNPLTTVTTIVVPPGAHPGKLVAFGNPEDSTGLQCSPSYEIQFGANPLNLDLTFIGDEAWIGLIVTFSDHEGPNSTFLAGRNAGRAVLDSIRATFNFRSSIGLNEDAKVAMWGYSGGADAIGWAASLKDTYAPELNVVGAAHGGTPADLMELALSADRGPISGFIVGAFVGLSAAYPSFNEAFSKVSTPKLKALMLDHPKHCLIVLKSTFQNLLSGTEYLTTGLATLQIPAIKAVIEDQKMGGNATLTPTMPMYIYHSQSDELVPYSIPKALVSTYCANGADVHFTTATGPGIEHVAYDVTGVPAAVQFLSDRLDGVPWPKGCSYADTLTGL
ncbi:hypothetical protein RQP46_011523 [Phenoliferia psychrophenolica]